ncbi:caspase, EACC1-associated type [Streptomyces antimycoticus]|uniref:caspase, EACC1-associated type n=1 Tax=Streptomyces antimycoticus TaxID=68175 RepID=UPI0025703129|nr:caspase family protein [Streptomyces antimycoticus]WJE01079.1 caspase family protein [Streptomyces antimycoticus]
MTGGLAAPGARAVLFGTGGHIRGSKLEDLPSVDTTLDDLRDTLLDVCGMAPGHVVRVPAHAHAAEVVGAVEEATAADGGPVLFYYAGHGLLGPRDDLYLATRASRSARHVAQSVSYRTIRDLLGEAPSGSLVVLDCCFSGRAGAPPAQGGARRAFASSRPRGSFLLTSASHYALSFAPEGERHTLFSGRLLELLNAGDPAGPLWLTADRLHAALDEEFADDGRVNPARQSEGTLGSLVLARNRAYPAGRTEEADRPADLPCPYPGLQPYRAEDSAHFFGREELTSRLFEMVEDAPDDGPVVLVGASGAGKSSVLRAGLLAGLEARATSLAPALLVPAPGPHPMRTLAEAWARATGRDTREVRAELERGCFPPPLHEQPACRLLVVDQFEEIFTRCHTPDERAAFVSVLTRNGPRPTPRVVLALRADHYGSCLEEPGLERALARAQLTVPPLRERELRAAVEGPAAAVGLTVEPGLTDRLLHDLRSGRSAHDAAAALPFLAHVLRETWRRRSGSRLTLSGYQATKGIWHSVATTTQRFYDSLDGEGRAMMRELLLRLVHLPPDGGAPVVRHRVPLAAVPAGSEDIRERLADARLLTADKDTVQIAHEALLRAWPQLRRWIEEDAATLLLRQQLGTAAEEWDTAGRDAAFLYRGSRLQAAVELAEQSELPAREAEFLATGQAAATSELHREQRRTRMLKRALAAVAVALCLALVAAVVAVRQQRNAEAQQRLATARSLLAEAGNLDTTDPRTALRLGLAAYALRPSADARRALFDTLAGNAFRGASRLPASETDGVLAAGGRRLATVSGEDLALWDTSRRSVPRTPLARLACPSKDGAGSSVAFGGPDDRMLAATCGEDEVRLWNVAGPWRDGGSRQVATLRAEDVTDETDRPAGVAVSPDGSMVAAIGWSRHGGPGMLTLWDVRDPRSPRRLSVVKDTSRLSLQSDRVAFSPDGHLLATADSNGDTRLWDLSNPREPRPRGKVEEGGDVLAFSPDGELLAVSDDRVVKMVDIRSPRHPEVLDEWTAHANTVGSLDFSPDGRRLASGGWDKSVALWNVGDPRDVTGLSRLAGHSSFVEATRFGADGRSLVSVSFGEVVHWDMADVDQTEVLDVIPDGNDLALAPDGTTLAATRGARIGLWDLADPAEPRRLAELDNPVENAYDGVGGTTVIGTGDVISDVAFSSDGALLATLNHDRRVTLWDVSDPARPRIAGSLSSDNQGAVGPSLAFAPDAPLLAVNDLEQVRVWDVSDPARPAVTRSRTLGGLREVAFSPDGRRLLLAGVRVHLWDLSSGKLTLLSGDHFYLAGSWAAFAPGGNTVAAVAQLPPTTGPDIGVHLWDAEHAGSARLRGETEPMGGDAAKTNRLAFHPEGDLLAGAGEDGAVRLWSVADPERPHLALTFGSHSEGVDDVVLGGPHGRTMITSSAGFAYVVDIGDYPEIAADTIGMACRVAGGGLTREQWADHVPAAEFVETCPKSSGHDGAT